MGSCKSEESKNHRDPGKTIEVLFRISQAVSGTRNLEELYRVIHRNLGDILNVDNFYIALHDREKDAITFPYHVDEKDRNPEEIHNFSQRPSFTGMVIQKQKPMIFYQADIVRILEEMKQPVIGTISKVWMGAPLIIRNRVKGAIAMQSYTSSAAYTKKDLDLLNSVSQHIALAIERKESEEKLEEHRRVLEKILESSPVGIALVQNRVFKWVNNEMVRMFGYASKKDFEHKSVRMIYADRDDFERAGEKIYKSLAETGTVDYEIDLMKRDTTLFPGHIRLNAGDRSDPMAWTIATVTDISQRKTVEKEKVEKERLQGVLEMAGAVCHEINQPLQAILGYSELLLMGSDSPCVEESNLNSIRSQAARLGRITRKLSSITHYKTVDYPGNTRIVDIWGSCGDTEH